MIPQRFTLVGAVHVFLLLNEQVLLLRRANAGYEDGNYSVPAGHLDGNETVIDAVIREAREEVGIVLVPSDITVVGVMHRRAERVSDAERIDFFVTARRWQGKLRNCEPHKCDELRWADLDQLPATVIPYVHRALDNYRYGRWFDSFGSA